MGVVFLCLSRIHPTAETVTKIIDLHNNQLFWIKNIMFRKKPERQLIEWLENKKYFIDPQEKISYILTATPSKVLVHTNIAIRNIKCLKNIRISVILKVI